MTKQTQNTHAQQKSKRFACPRCQTPTEFTNNPNKPFCSARCKLIDLGAWASEDYKIVSETAPSLKAEHGSAFLDNELG